MNGTQAEAAGKYFFSHKSSGNIPGNKLKVFEESFAQPLDLAAAFGGDRGTQMTALLKPYIDHAQSDC